MVHMVVRARDGEGFEKHDYFCELTGREIDLKEMSTSIWEFRGCLDSRNPSEVRKWEVQIPTSGVWMG